MKLRRRTALLLAALCLLLCACGRSGKADDRDSVTLWCLEEDPLCLPLQELVEQYNLNTGELLPVTLRSFPDEESLAAAFETGRPDLLLCTHGRAWSLAERGLLQDVYAGLGEAAPRYPESLQSAFPDMGRSFFPLGVQVSLLCVREEEPADWESLEQLCGEAVDYARAHGRPYLAVDRFEALFYQEMLLRGTEFHADAARDQNSSCYPEVYNLLAGCVFDGGIAQTERPAALLARDGAVPCAIGASSGFAALPGEGFVFRTLPGLGEEAVPGLAVGIAVTAPEGRGVRSAAGFLAWLFSEDRAGQTALDCGLIPAPQGGELRAEGALEELLLSLGRERAFHLYDPSGDYWKHRDAFEQSFRAVLQRFL